MTDIPEAVQTRVNEMHETLAKVDQSLAAPVRTTSGRAPLTSDEVEQLAEGARVTVIWSGGNGPHDYVIAVDRWGGRYAAINDDPDDRMRWYNPLTFVGGGKPFTRVWETS